MYLIVGLGNPGEKYEKTRHNVGFMVLNAAAKKLQASSFKLQARLNAEISKGTIEDKTVILAKPQTFMNSSGSPVKILIENWSLKIENLVIIHDDIDLPLGKIKISVGSSSAGHKGVESIIQQLGTKDFIRVRVGIQPERGKPEQVETFVVRQFSQKERPVLKQTIAKACDALDTILQDGLEQAMQKHNERGQR